MIERTMIAHPRYREKKEKKNLRRLSVVVTAQTQYHLYRMAAMNGWGEKDIGRVIDKLVRLERSRAHGTEL